MMAGDSVCLSTSMKALLLVDSAEPSGWCWPSELFCRRSLLYRSSRMSTAMKARDWKAIHEPKKRPPKSQNPHHQLTSSPSNSRRAMHKDGCILRPSQLLRSRRLSNELKDAARIRRDVKVRPADVLDVSHDQGRLGEGIFPAADVKGAADDACVVVGVQRPAACV